MNPPPPVSVLEAFGLSGRPEPLAGGQTTVWRVGEAVLKPDTHTAQELEWQAQVLGQVSQSHFRLSRPLRAHSGSLLVEGWSAWTYLTGRHEPGRWTEIVQVSQHFHQALAAVPRPAFLAARTDPWATADRMVWGELPLDDFLAAPYMRRLAQQLRPVHAPPQLIHGDLTGNVLFSEPDAPAVIDFSPYWRPAGFALAIVVADALVWEGADEGLLEAVRSVPDFPQFFLRALIFRRIVEELSPLPIKYGQEVSDPYQSAVDLAVRLASP
ncbi:TIGR02569 family protein [Deinococcus sp. Arct2-2]|uniref:TIGR02569 family protein n=1 Tax=Deinococcus sp. Arct2-2 TaxID=2568653 RepID=UPI0010A44E9D|nr:TIGR02569 family protein [Deinococcus sp. Arct2-2]THF68771.1 TIGR02569 family protein [Deinococcus sp. Arct2-2]